MERKIRSLGKRERERQRERIERIETEREREREREERERERERGKEREGKRERREKEKDSSLLFFSLYWIMFVSCDTGTMHERIHINSLCAATCDCGKRVTFSGESPHAMSVAARRIVSAATD
jgi:hypothetical protein